MRNCARWPARRCATACAVTRWTSPTPPCGWTVPSPNSSPTEVPPARRGSSPALGAEPPAAPAGPPGSGAAQALQAGDAFQAAALLLVDPAGLGGVLLRAPAGPVRDAWLSLLQALAPAGMPLPRLPASASEDRLLGGLDLSATLAAGRPVAQAGLLHQADGGGRKPRPAQPVAGGQAPRRPVQPQRAAGGEVANQALSRIAAGATATLAMTGDRGSWEPDASPLTATEEGGDLLLH